MFNGRSANKVRRKQKGLFLLFPLILLLLIALYLSFKYRFFTPSKEMSVPELTKQEKEEDFRYLTEFVKKCYPYADAVRDQKGLSSIKELSEQYIREAGETRDNREFLKLVMSYAQRLGQAGHYGIRFFSPEEFSLSTCLMFRLPKDVFYHSSYWSSLAQGLSVYEHAQLKVSYLDGEYVTLENYCEDGVNLPAGTTIRKVDGMPVDDYVKTLEDIQVLRLDKACQKVYSTNLFLRKRSTEFPVITVEVSLPTHEILTVKLKKKSGYANPKEGRKPEENLTCMELAPDTAYVYVESFALSYIQSDRQKLVDFFEKAEGKYQTLVIDVRGNQGGEPAYFFDNLICPFLKETVSYSERTVIQKSYFQTVGLSLPFYRIAASNHLLKKTKNHISSVKSVKEDGYDSELFRVYEIERTLKPTNTYDFSGTIYVLCNDETLSAGDSFLRAVKKTKIGLVAGVNSLGWGDIFMQPNYCVLKNSGLVLQMDIEMLLNEDKSINSLVGTTPDILLPREAAYPSGFTMEDIRKDEWILAILAKER